MLPYWILLLIPAVAALSEKSRFRPPSKYAYSWISIWLLLTVLIGLRFEVGGDWGTYERHFQAVDSLSFDQALQYESDVGYVLLNWIAAKLDLGVVAVNVVCAAVFASGLVSFVKEQPRPWLAIAIAIPYLVTVVAMGYSRQAVAIGFAMLAFSGLGANSAIRFAAWVTVAAFFHKSAVLLIPIAILAKTKSRIWTAVWIGAIGALLYYFLLAENIDRLIRNYVEAEYQSQGAAIRITMNALPAAAFLIYRRHFRLKGAELNLWTYLSIIALGFVLLFFLSPSSTAVDRVALYLIPIQIFVLSRLPAAMKSRYKAGDIVKVSVVGYSALVLFVWLNFAEHARYWLPYQMVLFQD
jgi:hypothetical protein